MLFQSRYIEQCFPGKSATAASTRREANVHVPSATAAALLPSRTSPSAMWLTEFPYWSADFSLQRAVVIRTTLITQREYPVRPRVLMTTLITRGPSCVHYRPGGTEPLSNHSGLLFIFPYAFSYWANLAPNIVRLHCEHAHRMKTRYPLYCESACECRSGSAGLPVIYLWRYLTSFVLFACSVHVISETRCLF